MDRRSPERVPGLAAGLAAWLVGLATTVVLLALVLGVAPAPAAAHGAEGRVEILVLESTGADRVRLEVGVAHTNDSDPADAATVTATVTATDGTVSGPVAVPHLRSGLYGGELAVAGTGPWSVVVTATNPAATTTGQAQPVATTTLAPTSTTTAPTSTRPAASDPPVLGTAATATKVEPPAGQGVDARPWIGGVLLAAIAAAAGIHRSRRRTSSGPPPA